MQMDYKNDKLIPHIISLLRQIHNVRALELVCKYLEQVRQNEADN